MQKYSDIILNHQGRPVSGATVKVTTYPGNAAATIYATDGGAAVDFVKSDSNGRFAFYAADGHYNLLITGRGIAPITVTDVTLNDPSNDNLSNSPAYFGAPLNGLGDDTAGIQAAINFVQTFTPGGMVEFPPGSKPKLLSGLTIDTNRCGINWNGAYVDCTSFAPGAALYTITQSASDVNRRPALNRAHPLRGAVYIGPGKTTSCTVANIRDMSADMVIAGVTFSDGGCWGWATGFTLGQGCFFTSFNNFDFAAVSGTDMGVCVSIPNAANSGEKNEFNNVRFGSADVYLVQDNGNADTHFNGVSMNYAARMMTVTAGSVYINRFHIEGNSDADFWFHLSTNSNAALIFAQGVFTIAAAKSIKSVIYCDAAVTNGGVALSQYTIANDSAYSLPLVSGTGRVQATQMMNYASGSQPITSARLNVLAYGDFESANYAADWALGGATPPARATTNPHSGANSLKFAGIAGQNNSAILTTACKPGQIPSVSYWAAVTGYGTGGNFYGTWAYLDKAGNVIGGPGAPMNFTATTAYTFVGFGSIPPAPLGTASLQIGISFFGVTAGTPFGYIDDVIVNII